MKKVLILSGGWEGHDPAGLTRRFEKIAAEAGAAVQTEHSPDCFADAGFLRQFDLLIPVWSYCGYVLPDEYAVNITDAVADGMGIAGCHGSMCDAFRESVLWQFLTGAQWVAHPGKPFVHCTPVNGSTEEMFFRKYSVHIRDRVSSITQGISDFDIESEQYYLHVDPSVHVLVETVFSAETDRGAPYIGDQDIVMPIAYTRKWGKGRIFYCSIGHNSGVFETCRDADRLMKNGILWAMGGESENVGKEKNAASPFINGDML